MIKYLKKRIIAYIFLISVSAVMLYPLLWLLGASFKSNEEIFSSVGIIPKSFDFSVFKAAWQTVTPYTMGHYFLNTFKIILPKTVFAVISSVLVAYGFSRFDFPFKKLFKALLLTSMLMPSIVTIMPMFLMWSKMQLLDTYIPLTIPALFAAEGMFVFILIRFFDAVPKEFDEAARNRRRWLIKNSGFHTRSVHKTGDNFDSSFHIFVDDERFFKSADNDSVRGKISALARTETICRQHRSKL